MNVNWVLIVGIPSGEAPLEIRKQWLGLELPLMPGRSSVYQVGAGGLLSGKAAADPIIGYLVSAHEAVEILASKSPDAAKWWRLFAPSHIAPGKSLVFDEYVCEPVDHAAPSLERLTSTFGLASDTPMKLHWLFVAIAYLLGVIALSYAGIVYSTGGSFAIWSPGHNIDYFLNIHAGLLEKAGIAIGALTFSLYFGLLLAFRKIRQLELQIATIRARSNQSTEPTPSSGTPPAGQEPRLP